MFRLIVSVLVCVFVVTAFLSLRGTDNSSTSSPAEMINAETSAPAVALSPITVSRDPPVFAPLGSEDPLVSERRLYKWRDAAGIINISTDPPPPGVPTQLFDYEVALASRAGTPERRLSRSAPTNPSIVRSDVSSNPLKVYTPAGMKELMNYAVEVGEQLRERERILTEVSRELQ